MKMKETRLRKEVTQVELSERTGLPQGFISRLENGGINIANIVTVIKIAKALNVQIEEILDLPEEE